jgi:thioredoxin reductase
MNELTTYDVIIIGGSYAGLSAGMTLGRSLRNVLIIDSGMPCNRQTPQSHNFLFGDGKTPAELTEAGRKAVLAYPTIKLLNATATSAQQTKTGFSIGIENGQHFEAKKLLFATGMRDKLPDIHGLAECWGISALHCPYCHGYEVKEEPTAVLARGEVAFEVGKLISNWTKQLIILTNGKHELTDEQVQKLNSKAIQIREEVIDRFVHENGRLTAVVFSGNQNLQLNAVYVRPEMEQHCKLPQNLGCQLTENGHIAVNEKSETSVPGIFAAGDNTDFFRAVSNAIASGTKAGAFINFSLINDSF